MSGDSPDHNVVGTSTMRSHELAELAGTTPRALRHYHKIGLLPEVPRDTNGYRRYGARDLVRVLRIRQLAAGGMSLRKIGSALDQDTRHQDDLLAELDRELKAQADKIETQRKIIADLRRLTNLTSHSATPNNTQPQCNSTRTCGR